MRILEHSNRPQQFIAKHPGWSAHYHGKALKFLRFIPMANSIARYEDTPNPNALKCVLAAPLSLEGDGPRSFRTAEQAAVHPLAARLFAAEGITGVLLNSTWLTVNKAPAAAWKPIKKAVEAALAETA